MRRRRFDSIVPRPTMSIHSCDNYLLVCPTVLFVLALGAPAQCRSLDRIAQRWLRSHRRSSSSRSLAVHSAAAHPQPHSTDRLSTLRTDYSVRACLQPLWTCGRTLSRAMVRAAVTSCGEDCGRTDWPKADRPTRLTQPKPNADQRVRKAAMAVLQAKDRQLHASGHRAVALLWFTLLL